jgi:hypothetical protein
MKNDFDEITGPWVWPRKEFRRLMLSVETSQPNRKANQKRLGDKITEQNIQELQHNYNMLNRQIMEHQKEKRERKAQE